MLIHYDLDAELLLDADQNALQLFALRYNADAEVRLRFRQAGVRVDPAGLTEIRLLVKTAGDYDEATPLVLAGSWTKVGTGATAEWVAYPDTTGEVIATALSVNSATADDKASVATQVDVTLVIAGRRRISNLVAGIIANSNYRDDDTPPTPEPAPGTFALSSQSVMWRADITALTGGAVNALDSLPTASGQIPLQKLVLLLLGGILQTWQLRAGTTAEDSAAGVVRPDDYAGGANEKVWVRLFPASLLALTGLTGGSANDLDGVATAAGATASQTIREVLTGSVGGEDLGVSRWVLMAGTNAEDGISYVRPDDYNASTNARVWVRIG